MITQRSRKSQQRNLRKNKDLARSGAKKNSIGEEDGHSKGDAGDYMGLRSNDQRDLLAIEFISFTRYKF